MIEKYLDDLERRIDPQTEDELLEDWKNFTYDKYDDGIFSPKRRRKAPSGISWPDIPINEAIEDTEKMALGQFFRCSNMLAHGNGTPLAVRCNYGTGIMPTMFGAEPFVMDEQMNTLPTSWPIKGGVDGIKDIVRRGVPDMRAGLGARTLDMAKIFLEIFRNYPKIGRYIYLYHPDMQGPMDICELLWGSSLFLDVMDYPDLVKSLLKLITETYIRFMKEWEKIVPFKESYSVHWSLMHKGHIMLRDDSAMNFSPEMFAEFIQPYDQRVLDEFGGGALHFCGRGDHYIKKVCEMKGLYAVAMSQPDYNNMEIIYNNTVDRNIKLIGFSRSVAEQAIASGRDLKGNVHCSE